MHCLVTPLLNKVFTYLLTNWKIKCQLKIVGIPGIMDENGPISEEVLPQLRVEHSSSVGDILILLFQENGKVQNQETGSMSSPEADTDAPYDSSDKQSSEYKEEEIVETLDCFAKISPASSCDPNMTKRKFIKLSEVKRFLSGDS